MAHRESHVITCPACGAANRVPSSREGERGRCGACHESLPPLFTTPVTLNDESFDRFIKGIRLPVLAEFWAPW